MRQRAVGPHRNSRELRCPGSCGGDEGEHGLRGKYVAISNENNIGCFPQVPFDLRGCHTHAVCQSRGTG